MCFVEFLQQRLVSTFRKSALLIQQGQYSKFLIIEHQHYNIYMIMTMNKYD